MCGGKKMGDDPDERETEELSVMDVLVKNMLKKINELKGTH